MKYLNFILTTIAVLLLIHLLIQILPVKSIEAGPGMVDVNIKYIGGNRIYDKTIPVRMKK